MAHGVFVWNELNTRDIERAKTFYSDTLGWTFDAMNTTGNAVPYWIAKSGDRAVAGVFDISDPSYEDLAEGWVAYIDVDDVDLRLEAAEAAGGHVMRAPWDIPGIGRIAILQQPGGAVIGWMTVAPMALRAASAA